MQDMQCLGHIALNLECTGWQDRHYLVGRQGDIVLRALHDERVRDTAGYGHMQRKAAALLRLTVNINASFEGRNPVIDNVHAHSPAGHLSNLVARAEAGLQDQTAQFCIAKLGARSQQAKGLRLFSDGGQVQPTPVIGHHDFNFLAHCPKRNRHHTLFAFATDSTLGW